MTLAIAHAFGFTNSPSFIVAKSDGSDPQKIEEAQPFIAFKMVIDKEPPVTFCSEKNVSRKDCFLIYMI
jgi:hypothetical protein